MTIYYLAKAFIISCVLVLILGGIAYAQIPFGVSLTEVRMSGTLDADYTVDMLPGNKPGWLENQWKEGNWTSIGISGIEYELNFWNAGKLGGTTGMLFWKKDYEDATLTVSYRVSDNGYIVGKPNKVFGGMDAFPLEPASKAPSFKPVVIKFKFSGGPAGVFVEQTPYLGGDKPITGRIIKGKEVIFEYWGSGMEKGPLALGNFLNTALPVPGDPFYRWEVETKDRVDSEVRFAGLSGQVEVRPENDEDAWDFAQMGMVLYCEDHIKTGPRSSAILSFKDLSTFVMRADTEIILATPPEKETKMELVIGNIWGNIKKMAKDGTMEVTMNQGVAGIKGTTFVCESTATTSTLKVIEGSVEFRDKPGKTVIVNGGEKVSATSSGLGAKETFDAALEKQQWKGLTEIGAPFNWGLVIGVMAVLIAVLAVILLFVLKKKKLKPSSLR